VNLLPFFQWCEGTPIGAAIRESVWLFPVVECVHLIALAWVGGAIVVVDLRLLGFGLRQQPVSSVAADARRWLVAGLAVLVITGVLLFLSEAVKCYETPVFWVKMGTLALAIAFTFGVRERACRRAAGGPMRFAKVVACVSLALWFTVALAGRAIGFY
jgi:hypothetical protein